MKRPELTPLFLSKEKFNEITAELHDIETLHLPEIRIRMATAYEDGDIPENNPYLTANDDMQVMLMRRNQLREMIARAKLYKKKRKSPKIALGTTFNIELSGEQRQITLVSSEEASPINGKLSIDSPIGSALFGHISGESVNAETPSGTLTIHIL